MTSTIQFLTLAAVCCLVAGAPASPMDQDHQRSFMGGFGGSPYGSMYNQPMMPMMSGSFNQPMGYPNMPMGMNSFANPMAGGFSPMGGMGGYPGSFGGSPMMGAASFGQPGMMGPGQSVMMGPGQPGMMGPGLSGMMGQYQFQSPFRNADEKVDKH